MNEGFKNKEELLSIKPVGRFPENIKMTFAITMEQLENLVPFDGHPFSMYSGQRFADMFESIRTNGVLVPIVVRPYSREEGKYEILSGHNRVAAAKEAGIKSIPAIIKKGLTDDEALLIVTETNLIQRSFADLKHSERAIVISVHYEAMKKKSGYRSDLISEIEELSGVPVGHRMKTRDKLGEQYGLGKTTIARYLRINKLIPGLKEQLDKHEIGMRVAESLSFLDIKAQEMIEELLTNGKKISIEQAELIKENSQKGELTKTSACEILDPQCSNIKSKPIKLNTQFLSKYFKPEQNTDEIKDIISKTLEQYFTNRND